MAYKLRHCIYFFIGISYVYISIVNKLTAIDSSIIPRKLTIISKPLIIMLREITESNKIALFQCKFLTRTTHIFNIYIFKLQIMILF